MFVLFDHVCDELRIRDRVSTENAFKMFNTQPNRFFSSRLKFSFTNVKHSIHNKHTNLLLKLIFLLHFFRINTHFAF